MSLAAPRAESASESVVPTVLLVGRPNCGKSSLFNAVTGGNAKEGNFPGITVDVLEAALTLPGGGKARLVDLPGTYSLLANVDPESDEGHARRYLEHARQEGPVVVAQVLDSTNLTLNLRLTRELQQLGVPLLLLVSQRDVLEREGMGLDLPRLEAAAGAPALWVSARSPATRAAVLEGLEQMIAKGQSVKEVPPLDPAALAGALLVAPKRPEGASGRLALFRRTAAADRYLMHPILGPLAFLGLMGLLFTAVFMIADPATAVVGSGIDLLGHGLRKALGDGALSHFLREGILGGAGTVLEFLPQIVLLTVALELIEASGYLARGAYLVDRLLSTLGLGGRAFVPLLMGHACAVPAISATRTIRDPRQRLRTILVIPLMTCSARIPAYALLIAAFFPTLGAVGQAMVFLALYAAGLVMGALASLFIGGSVLRKKKSMPLVLELPPYRAPRLRGIAQVAWRSARQFMVDVGTIIVAVSAVLWVLLSVPVAPPSPGAAASHVPTRTQVMRRSLAAEVGKALEPITRPVGFDWRVNVALIGSFGAREVMVSTMGVIFGIANADADHVGSLPDQIRKARAPGGGPAYSTATGLALLAFFVLACQCVSTLSAIRKETHSWRWPAFVLVYTYTAAYLAAFAVFHVARFFGL